MRFESADKVKRAYCALELTTFVVFPQRYFFMTLTSLLIMSGIVELLRGTQTTRHEAFYDFLANLPEFVFAYGVSLVCKKHRPA